MATVYLARLTGGGGFLRFVAIKRLHPHLANEKEFVEMFLDEARIAARIHHPNVVPILEVGASAVGYYLVMEYIEGDTLARLLARAATRGKRLPVGIALRIALDMLAGLRVARAASRLTATRVGQLKGKIAYMAPEQAAGEEAIDRRADVFAAGIVVWEELAAKRLFKAENEAATLSRVMTEAITPLTTIVPGLSTALSNVVLRALEREPDQRFSSCAQFADALEAAPTGVESIATPRELAAYVSEVMGDEVIAQREAVRAWIARSEPSQIGADKPSVSPSTSVSAAAMSLPGHDPSQALLTQNTAPKGRSPARLFALVTLLLLLVGGGSFLFARQTSPDNRL